MENRNTIIHTRVTCKCHADKDQARTLNASNKVSGDSIIRKAASFRRQNRGCIAQEHHQPSAHTRAQGQGVYSSRSRTTRITTATPRCHSSSASCAASPSSLPPLRCGGRRGARRRPRLRRAPMRRLLRVAPTPSEAAKRSNTRTTLARDTGFDDTTSPVTALIAAARPRSPAPLVTTPHEHDTSLQHTS